MNHILFSMMPKLLLSLACAVAAAGAGYLASLTLIDFIAGIRQFEQAWLDSIGRLARSILATAMEGALLVIPALLLYGMIAMALRNHRLLLLATLILFQILLAAFLVGLGFGALQVTPFALGLLGAQLCFHWFWRAKT